MLKAAIGYAIEHRKQNILLFQPNDTQAKSFMKSHIEPMIRDVPVLKNIAPWIDKKHKDSSLTAKRFSNQRQLFVHGGEAAANYREKSVQVVAYDELAAFTPDVQGEGDPCMLGDRRLQGAAGGGKSIRGSTPKIKHACQIERAAREAEARFYFEVPCPHCGRCRSSNLVGVIVIMV
ncbi:phage terminase [Vibrio ishigakensis]|uniref:Phage terminase n=1 Tax=Vibrio ishigakensis TaxID=1481914 RepID=A0A0B8PLS3_9VIBR|nr:phage terminase [Vibrio ishigakensis]